MSKPVCDAIDAVIEADPYRDPSDKYVNRSKSRRAAGNLWREMAKGQFTAEHLAFIQAVALAIVAVEDAPEKLKSTARNEYLAYATGLSGTPDKYGNVREAMDANFIFEDEVMPQKKLDFLDANRGLIPWDGMDPAESPEFYSRRELREVLTAIERSRMRKN